MKTSIAILMAVSSLSFSGPPPASRPATEPGRPDGATLLREVDRLLAASATTRPATHYLSDRAARAARLETLVAEIDALLAVAPADSARDELLIRKLAALYDVATIRGESLAALRVEAERILGGKPGDALAAAAEYARLRAELDSGSPAGAPPPPPARMRRIERFIEAHPQHAAAPGLIAELIDLATAERDFATAERWLARLQRDGAGHADAASLVGQDRMRRAVGEPWTPLWSDLTGAALDWARFRGRPAVIVFWAAWDAPATRVLEQIAAWPEMAATARPACVVVSLDRRREDATAGLARTKLAAVLCCDGRGWASPPARESGVRTLPLVLMLDAEGRLRQVVEGGAEDIAPRLEAAWRDVGGRLP